METISTTHFEISFEDRDKYLYVYVAGERDCLKTSLKYWKLVLEQTEKTKLSKVLVEENFPNQLSVIEMHQISEKVSEMFRSKARIALVDRSLGDLELNIFGETVCVNRGLSAGAFPTFESAETWLLESS